MKNNFIKNGLCVLLIGLLFSSCRKDRVAYTTIDNQTFVTEASSSNNFEVLAGTLAVQKGQNASIKHYGEHMVNDHTAAGLELKAVADQKGFTVLPPTELLGKHRQQLELLANASTDFDQQFAQIMVKSHQEAVNLFELAASDQGVSDLTLRSFAAGKIPTLRAHLEDARKLQTTP